MCERWAVLAAVKWRGGMILLNVDRKAQMPVFMQIAGQLRQLMESGSLKVGAQLPATRALAQALGVNRTTVCEAYQELWALGYIESRAGSYTRVRERGRIAGPQGRAGSAGGRRRRAPAGTSTSA